MKLLSLDFRHSPYLNHPYMRKALKDLKGKTQTFNSCWNTKKHIITNQISQNKNS